MPVGSTLPIGALAPPASDPRPRDVQQASRQFEALLIGQMLKSARGDDADGWLGSGDEPGSDTATELAEQQFAQALAQHGGLGLSTRIAASLSSASPSLKSPSVKSAPLNSAPLKSPSAGAALSKTPLPRTLGSRIGR